MVLIISFPMVLASENMGWKNFCVSSNCLRYKSKFPNDIMLDHFLAATVNSKSSCSKMESFTATSIHSSRSPGVQNKYSVTPKNISNNGVEQIIWS
ncbi:hypothetical protein PGUG_02401 [Meyerozyma guilliermondii ATCC 6260]|uniref:Uncharacterized protein n=1 Tax=Meyerozyma guilliermondii (strain ATCC 6260 / CBS 566 / DSM 6381 / JCM 1539 / NBRC 10279 / NRRL Y-324) TaxID=294746 RepID=A5DGK0_PICGU|nr:uncharacterized protein PGUG_02401 [Meyerozyma guilliermondii ATCC 6260]EDK38302.2 hypothetical protein PGUG_02401 [Meyerozyma guilliermondii ATCC 6260]